RSHRLVAVNAHDRQFAAVYLLRQVNARRPRVTAVERFEELVRAHIDDARGVRREGDRRGSGGPILLAGPRRGTVVALTRRGAEAETARGVHHLRDLFLWGLLPFARLGAGLTGRLIGRLT